MVRPTGNKLLSFDGTIADVTMRKEAESALRETQQRYHNLFNSMDEGYCTIQVIFSQEGEPVDWRFLEVNQSFRKQTGLENVLGKRMREIAPEHEGYWFEIYGRVARTGEPTRFVNQAHSLGGRWFDLYAFRIGEPEELKVAVLFRDITERRQSEKQLAEQAEALVDLHRRKDEFLAMLSHELRSPLAPISNAVHLLALNKNADATQQLARGIIERQVGQLKHLIDDLLEVSRITTGRVQLRLEPVSCTGIVARAIETAQPLVLQRRHRLEVAMPAEPVALHADAARLEQVVVNLLTNAAKYTDVGGHIWLSVHVEAQEAVLSVRDNGVGIAPELLPKIFDLFTQADRSLDRSEGGLGIGLCLVQRLVQLHAGSVQAHSVLGQGSEFVVRLPLLAAQAQQPAETRFDQTQDTAQRRRVLVVDDNVDAAQSLASLLKHVGHDVHVAHDGIAALEAAFALHPEVILLDIGLPGLSGLEVAKAIRQNGSITQPLLVALTGYGQDTDRALSHTAGFDHHLVKPAEFRAVQKILSGGVGEP